MKKLSGYGTLPDVVCSTDIEFSEFMFYLYLPVKMAGVEWDYSEIPANLHFLYQMLDKIEVENDDYVYVTAKNMWYEAGGTYNREGWHSDGFMTKDINYIWSDGLGTEFVTGQFLLSQDHDQSLYELSCINSKGSVTSFPSGTLLKLDEKVIHRPPAVTESGMRAFVKISVSKDKYNLKGNSHNHLIDYNWETCDRKATRNDPICSTQKDK
tara:strand:+ start:2611 stop:3243 length:633 start_codon:yes stop_codon:yes gene_type:complete